MTETSETQISRFPVSDLEWRAWAVEQAIKAGCGPQNIEHYAANILLFTFPVVDEVDK